MKKTLAICTSHRGASDPTLEGLRALSAAGCLVRVWHGLADVALARNIYMTRGLEIAKQSQRSVILLVDDDMKFDVETAQLLVDRARTSGAPVSAAYATANAHLAATTFNGGKWLVGLGFLAVPVERLQALADSSPRVETVNGEFCHPFTWTGPERDGDRPFWLSEDYRLSQRLGGVILEPVAVGHVKQIPIYPDTKTLEEIRARIPTGHPETETSGALNVETS